MIHLLLKFNRSFCSKIQGGKQSFLGIENKQFVTDFMKNKNLNNIWELSQYKTQLQRDLQIQLENQSYKYDLLEASSILDTYLNYSLSHILKVDLQLTQQLTAIQSYAKDDPKYFLIMLCACVKLFEQQKYTKDFQAPLIAYLYQVFYKNQVTKLFEQFSNQICFGDAQDLFPQKNKHLIALNRNKLQLDVFYMILYILDKYFLQMKNVNLQQQECQFVENFFNQVNLYLLYMKFDWSVSFGIVKMLSNYLMNLPKNQINSFCQRFQRILIRSMDQLALNLSQMKNNQIILLMYILAKWTMNTQNIKTYIEFWNNILITVNDRLHQLQTNECKSLYYSIGKIGFVDKKIKNFLMLKVEEAVNDQDKKLEYLVYMFISISNINIFDENKQSLKNLIEKIFQIILKSEDTKGQKLKILYFVGLMRLEIRETKYWELFFDIIEDKKINYNYDLVRLLQHLKVEKSMFCEKIQILIKEKIEDQVSVMEKLEQYNTQLQDQKTQKKGDGQFYLEDHISKALISRGEEFQRNQILQYHEVDFYLPKRNMIIETMGPHHFIFSRDPNEGKLFNFKINETTELKFYMEYNLITKQKIKRLKQFGYNVKTIDFYEFQGRSQEDILRDIFKE